MNRITIFVVTFLISLTSLGHQPDKGILTIVSGPILNQTLNTDTNALFGLGVSAELDFSTVGGIETGLFYFLKTYKRSVGNSSIIEQVRKLAIPLGYRFWLTPQISLGLFFNSLFSNGSYQVNYNTLSTAEYTLARMIPEYGLEASFHWEIFNNSKIAFITDLRYFYSISAQSRENADHYIFLLGLKFFGK